MPHDPADQSTGRATPEDRRRIEHMLRCSLDARDIVGRDDADRHQFGHGANARARQLLYGDWRGRRETFSGWASEGGNRAVAAVGMRNIVVHVHWGIDFAEPVTTVRDDLPDFLAALEAALRAWPAEQPDKQ